jgi:hypothetical protein
VGNFVTFAGVLLTVFCILDFYFVLSLNTWLLDGAFCLNFADSFRDGF